MIKFKVNGNAHELQVETEQPLLWVLRDVLGLKGTKYGCGVGICGICMVDINGEAMRSCVIPVSSVADKEVTTIEGLSLEHPVVQAWLTERVPQCGYCQPGQLIATIALLQRNHEPDDTAINAAMSGILCRCGTYPRIRRAIYRAVEVNQSVASPKRSIAPFVKVDPLVTAEFKPESPDVFAPNPWVRVNRDGTVTVIIDRSEMGQGVITGFAMLVAEELEIGLDHIDIAFAPANPVYINPIIGEQLTGGSTSIRGSWNQLRRAGAEAREILKMAAAQIWGVPRDECRAQHGQILHSMSARRIGYGELVSVARMVGSPGEVSLKQPNDFELIGRSTPRLDAAAMVLGRTLYGMDISLPGMYVASVERPPTLGGRLQEFNASKACQIPGVIKVVEIFSGVAVIANSTYAALKGRAALEINWKSGPRDRLSTAAIQQGFKQAANRTGTVQRKQGNALDVLKSTPHLIEAAYDTPYLAHGCLEPMNCTARVSKNSCEVWVGTQAQTGDQQAAAQITQLPKEQVHIHTQFLGGGFGRRGDSDFVREAVQIAQTVENPVQLVWTRKDDIQYDHYRPANYTVMRASLDKQNMPLAWFQRVVGPSLALDGVKVPYAIPNIRIEFVKQDPLVPTGAWRSVGASQNAFSIECFIDELAHAAGKDPVEYRLALLAHTSRYTRVLETAADKTDWTPDATGNRRQGVAFYHSFKSTVAQIAEVSCPAKGEIRIQRVVCVIDCGIAVNPDQVIAQLEGAIVFGLSAALKGEITIENAQIQQSTFEDYPILTMAETPEIEVHIVPSTEPPGGVGEPGVPPIAPAVANAVFAATGKRLRSLPLRIN